MKALGQLRRRCSAWCEGGALALAALSGCAGPSQLPSRQQSTLSEGEWTPYSQLEPDSRGFERFWRRPGVTVGTVKWDARRSRVVKAAPGALLQTIRDEVGRLNQESRPGEDVWLTVNVYAWEQLFFSRAPRAGVELVGRDRKGQVVWMGQSAIVAREVLAKSAADGPAAIIAQQLTAHLQAELKL